MATYHLRTWPRTPTFGRAPLTLRPGTLPPDRGAGGARLTAEAEAEARKAVGLEPLPEQPREEVPADLDAQIREAERVGDVERSIALKNRKLRATRR